MRRTFLFNAEGRPVSALIAKEQFESAFKIGLKIEVLRVLDLMPYALVERGERGIVAQIDEDSGQVWIKLELFHAGLCDYDNHIWLMPFDTDDILDGICCISGT